MAQALVRVPLVESSPSRWHHHVRNMCKTEREQGKTGSQSDRLGTNWGPTRTTLIPLESMTPDDLRTSHWTPPLKDPLPLNTGTQNQAPNHELEGHTQNIQPATVETCTERMAIYSVRQKPSIKMQMGPDYVNTKNDQ